MAQDSTKHREIGVATTNLEQFGFVFKTGKELSLWRFTSLFLSGNNDKNSEYSGNNTPVSTENSNSYSVGFKIGREKRTKILESLLLSCGVDASFGYSYKNDKTTTGTSSDNVIYTKTCTYQPGINLVFGFNYAIKDKLLVGAEIMPSVIFEKSNTETMKLYKLWESKSQKIHYGLTSDYLLLSVSLKI